MPVAIPDNTFTFSVGKQSAKGTPQTTPAYKMRATGGFGPDPAWNVVTLAESDSSSLATGTVRTNYTIAGNTDGYIRPDEFGLLAYLTMGANADSGAGPYVHTATHALSAPYATIFNTINTTTLVDRYTDCRIGSLAVNGSAGGILTYSATWGGLSALFGTTDPVLAPVATVPLNYSQVTCTIAGSAPGTVRSFSLTINNTGSFWEGDSGVTAVDYILGRKIVSGTIEMMFENDQAYREFHTGSTSGTVPSQTIVNKTLTITAQASASAIVSFQMQNVRYDTYAPTLGTSGGPIPAAITFSAQNLGTVGQYLSIVTTNSVTTY